MSGFAVCGEEVMAWRTRMLMQDHPFPIASASLFPLRWGKNARSFGLQRIRSQAA
jgi:hypothetical protein